MTKYNAKKIVVEYKVLGKDNVNEFIDKEAEKMANACGLEFVGSGYDFKTKTRDLEFGSEIINK